MKKLKYLGGEKIMINLPSGNYKVSETKNILILSNDEAKIIIGKNSELFKPFVEKIKEKVKAKKKAKSKTKRRKV